MKGLGAIYYPVAYRSIESCKRYTNCDSQSNCQLIGQIMRVWVVYNPRL